MQLFFILEWQKHGIAGEKKPGFDGLLIAAGKQCLKKYFYVYGLYF